MPSYITNPQVAQVSAIYPGDSILLVNNAATDSGVTKTVQFAFGPTPGSSAGTLTVVNTTNQTATGQVAWADADGNYEPASGMIVNSGQTLPYNLSGGWIRFTFSTAPTSGSLVATR